MMNRQRARILGAAVIAPAIGIAVFASASPAMATGSISRSAAQATALTRTGGGQVLEAQKETEHGRQVWCVEIRKGSYVHDVDVSRHSYRIIEVESAPASDD